MEELIDIQLHPADPSKTTKVGALLPSDLRRDFEIVLAENADVLVWSHENMLEIDTSFMVHRLNVDPRNKVVQQKRMTQMKCVEVERLVSITKTKTSSFIWKSIIYCYGVTCAIVTENER